MSAVAIVIAVLLVGDLFVSIFACLLLSRQTTKSKIESLNISLDQLQLIVDHSQSPHRDAALEHLAHAEKLLEHATTKLLTDRASANSLADQAFQKMREARLLVQSRNNNT
jgi:hypothetical protein